MAGRHNDQQSHRRTNASQLDPQGCRAPDQVILVNEMRSLASDGNLTIYSETWLSIITGTTPTKQP